MYGRKAMGEEFTWRVKYRVHTMPSNKWQYEYFRNKADADSFATAQLAKDCLVKVQPNKY